MKFSKASFFSVLAVLILTPLKGVSQEAASEKQEHDKIKTAAKEIISAASTCALITLDKEGRPRVRAMDPFSPEDDFVVWFGTNNQSRKVDQIKNDSRVTLYYLDADASGYVMIYGQAQLINDPQKKEKYWKTAWEAFYPNSRENYLLIKVTPEWMEVSSAPRGIHGDSITWQPPVLKFNKNRH